MPTIIHERAADELADRAVVQGQRDGIKRFVLGVTRGSQQFLEVPPEFADHPAEAAYISANIAGYVAAMRDHETGRLRIADCGLRISGQASADAQRPSAGGRAIAAFRLNLQPGRCVLLIALIVALLFLSGCNAMTAGRILP